MRVLVPTPCLKLRPRCRSRLAALRACGRLYCVRCGADRGPLSRDTINFIKATEGQFGPLADPVILHAKRQA
jgi:hypothetical protein